MEVSDPHFSTDTLIQLIRFLTVHFSLQGPIGFLSASLDKGLLFLLFLTQQRLYQRLAHTLGETELEDYVASGFLYLAVCRAEERVVTAAAVLGIRAASCSLVVMRFIGSKFCRCKNTAEGVMVELNRQKSTVVTANV